MQPETITIYRCRRCGERRKEPDDAMRHHVACTARALVTADRQAAKERNGHTLTPALADSLLQLADTDLYAVVHLALRAGQDATLEIEPLEAIPEPITWRPPSPPA